MVEMADTEKPKGELYSRLYIERGELKSDGTRLRERIIAQVHSFQMPFQLADQIHQKLGVIVPMGYERANWDRFFRECEIEDLLSAITLARRVLSVQHGRSDADAWV